MKGLSPEVLMCPGLWAELSLYKALSRRWRREHSQRKKKRGGTPEVRAEKAGTRGMLEPRHLLTEARGHLVPAGPGSSSSRTGAGASGGLTVCPRAFGASEQLTALSGF